VSFIRPPTEPRHFADETRHDPLNLCSEATSLSHEELTRKKKHISLSLFINSDFKFTSTALSYYFYAFRPVAHLIVRVNILKLRQPEDDSLMSRIMSPSGNFLK
jgi:hypothetical protein